MKKLLFLNLAMFILCSLLSAQTNYWDGSFNSYWHNANNWSLGHIPLATEDAVITTSGYTCNVDYYDDACASLTINSGATLRIADQKLTVSGSVNIYGELEMTSTSAELDCDDITWQSGSTADMTGSCTIYVEGTWEFVSGAEVFLTSGYVNFDGGSNSYIRSKDDDSHFNHIRNYKSSGLLGHSGQSTQPLDINGNMYCYSGTEFRSYSAQPIEFGGFINNIAGHLYIDNGTFKFDGGSTTNHFRPGDYLNNLTVASSGTTLFDDDIEIKGTVRLESGILSPGSNTITVGGNWENVAGTGAFAEGTSAVIFNGSGHQYCNYDENFYTLQIHKTGALRVNNASAELYCAIYDWVDGAIDILAGTFTADDLSLSQIMGSWYLNDGGEINISNYGSTVNLAGELYIYGGTFNVYGGSVVSYWPSPSETASITMSGGVLDFKDVGINIFNSGTLTENITGGVIRTADDFYCHRPDFTPTSSIIEMYGSNNSGLYLFDGHIFQLNVSKTGATVTAYQNISYDLDHIVVLNGTFYPSTYEIQLNGEMIVHDELKMDEYWSTVEVRDFWWKSGSDDDCTYGSINVRRNWYFESGTNAQLDNLFNVRFISTSPSIIYCYDDDAAFGNVYFDKTDGSVITTTISSASTYPMITDDAYINNDDKVIVSNASWVPDWDIIIQDGGTLEVGTGGHIYSTGISEDIEINGTLDLNGGLIEIAGAELNSTGILNINSGHFDIYGNEHLQPDGTFNMSGGEFSIWGTMAIQSGFTDNISGGIINMKANFEAISPGTWEPTGGVMNLKNGVGTAPDITVSGGNYLWDCEVIHSGGNRHDIQDDLTIKGDLTITSGSLRTNSYDLFIGGDWTNNATFTEYTGTVYFNGNSTQTIHTNEAFYNLTIDNSYSLFNSVVVLSNNTITVSNSLNIFDGVLELDPNSELNVNGDVAILTDAGLNANDDNVEVFVGGGWLNLNTAYDITYGFNPGISSTVTFDGSSDQHLITAAPQESFFNFRMDKSNGKFRAGDNLRFFGDFECIDGSFHDDELNLDHVLYGDFRSEVSAYITHTPGATTTFTFKGTADQEIYSDDNFGQSLFSHLIIDKTSGDVIEWKDDYGNLQTYSKEVPENSKALTVTITHDWVGTAATTVIEGTLDANGRNLTAHSLMEILDGGQIVVGPDGVIGIYTGYNCYVRNGGVLDLVGTSDERTQFWCNDGTGGSAGLYVESGGTIKADYCDFERIAPTGVVIENGAIVDPAYSFNNCSFSGYDPGGTLLVIENNQILTIDSVNFLPNTWGGVYNVSKTVTQGQVNFTNVDPASGFAGEDYEDDTYNLINWFDMNPGRWTGLESDYWNDAGNWEFHLKPGPGDDVYIPAGTPHYPQVAFANQECNNITVESGAFLRVYDLMLTAHGNMDIHGELQMDDPSGILNIGGDITWHPGSTDLIFSGTINIEGSWTF